MAINTEKEIMITVHHPRVELVDDPDERVWIDLVANNYPDNVRLSFSELSLKEFTKKANELRGVDSSKDCCEMQRKAESYKRAYSELYDAAREVLNITPYDGQGSEMAQLRRVLRDDSDTEAQREAEGEDGLGKI